ncbi:MAG: ornithine carbamoyltransferase [Candidatus Thermoplasmatota archaeon]|nr:ornithine carbamoyltransferase [Candidatus Thermoplasmatota archaeon]MCL5791372.1 ornithine carbamoyltransferase [Candidatus Thermoplasmatota archaeon]
MFKKDLISIRDLGDDFPEVINLALRLKRDRYRKRESVKGRSIGMIFEKSSTRTRVSLETAVFQLGGHGIFLNPNDMQMGRGETVSDTAHVLSGMLDLITYRAFSHENVLLLARNSSVPVINALDDKEHPLQLIADYLTIAERKNRISGLKFAYVGDGNNMANSIMLASAMAGSDVSIATPKGYDPAKEYVESAREIAKEMGTKVELTNDPVTAVTDADIVYTDVWVSMGEEKQREEKEKAFRAFQINSNLVQHAKKDFIFMHCLPAHRGMEVTDEVADSINSVIFQEAENRLHSAKAAIVYLLEN